LGVGEAFARETTTVKMANTQEQAMDESFMFQPHFILLNIDQSNGEAFAYVDWLREQEILARVVLVIYSGSRFKSKASVQFGMEPAALLRQARVQPEQLEFLLLTLLKGAHQLEVDQETPDVSGVRGD